MAAFGISTPDIERAKVAAYNKFHPVKMSVEL